MKQEKLGKRQIVSNKLLKKMMRKIAKFRDIEILKKIILTQN